MIFLNMMVHERPIITTFFLLLGLVLVTSQYSAPKLGNSLDIKVGSLSAPYATKCYTYSYFAVNFVSPCKDMILKLEEISGTPIIYISRTNPYPTKYDLTWSAYSADMYNLVINRNDPKAAPGYYYIAIYADCDTKNNVPANYRIRVIPSSIQTVSIYNLDILQFRDVSTNQYVAAGEFSYFDFCLPSCADVNIKITSCKDKARCPTSYSFPELFVSRMPLTSSLEGYR